MAKISLDLDRGDVSVEDFTEALGLQVRLVREVMAEMRIPANEVRWVIVNLRYGSTYAEAQAQILSDRVYMADVEQAVTNVGTGLRGLGSAPQRPQFFNDEALRLSRKLFDLGVQSSAGKARLRFGRATVLLTGGVSANVDAIIKGDVRSIASIEGTLIGVQGSDGDYKISIRDRLRGRKVACHLPTDLLRRALDAFETRVIVRGVVWSRPDGWPSRIEVRHFEQMPPDDALPSANDVRGILRDYKRADGD